MGRVIGVLALLLAAGAAAGSAAKEGDQLLGRPAPPLEARAWLQGGPEAPDLRGKVVLVRWWTDGCSLCVRTAPALNRLHAEFGERGLAVVGVYHPKPPGPRDPAALRAAIRRLGFRFPVALDERWEVLRRWWLDSGPRAYTSVSFLLDRAGRVRLIHPGGEFFPSDRPEEARQDRDYREIRALVERLLREKPPAQRAGWP